MLAAVPEPGANCRPPGPLAGLAPRTSVPAACAIEALLLDRINPNGDRIDRGRSPYDRRRRKSMSTTMRAAPENGSAGVDRPWWILKLKVDERLGPRRRQE